MKDFERSSKIVLNLVRANLALGDTENAAEVIRNAMVSASEVGAERIRQVSNAFDLRAT